MVASDLTASGPQISWMTPPLTGTHNQIPGTTGVLSKKKPLTFGKCSLEHSPELSFEPDELPPPSADDRLRPNSERPPDKLGDPSLDRDPPSGSGDNRGLESRRRHCPENCSILISKLFLH